MDKPNNSFDLIVADLMLRVSVLEKLLVDKNIISKEEWLVSIEEIAKKAADNIIEQVKANKSVDDILSTLNITDEEKQSLKN
jgi:hypothetical protein